MIKSLFNTLNNENANKIVSMDRNAVGDVNVRKIALTNLLCNINNNEYVKAYSQTYYNQPICYQLDLEHLYKDWLAVNFTGNDDVNIDDRDKFLSILYEYESCFYLLIRLSENNQSTIMVLEGDYTRNNYNDNGSNFTLRDNIKE